MYPNHIKAATAIKSKEASNAIGTLGVLFFSFRLANEKSVCSMTVAKKR